MGTSTSKQKKSKPIKGQTVIKSPPVKIRKPFSTDSGNVHKIPQDLFFVIASYCDEKSILSLSRTCKIFYFNLLDLKFWSNQSQLRTDLCFEDEFIDNKYTNAKCWYFHNMRSQVKVDLNYRRGVAERRQVGIFGASKVGKTQLINGLLRKNFCTEQVTPPHDEYENSYWEFNHHVSRIWLWESPSYEIDFLSARLIAYSVADRESFSALDQLYIEYPHVEVLLVSTKNDLPLGERVVTSAEGKEWAEKHRIGFFETSAKTGQGLEHIRRQIMKFAGEHNGD